MKKDLLRHSRRLLTIGFFLLALSLWGAGEQGDPRTAYFLRMARDQKITPDSRIAAYDSVLSIWHFDLQKMMKIGKEKVLLCNSLHRPDLGADTWDRILLKMKTANPEQLCRILTEGSLADRRASRHRAMIGKVMDILAIEKPDSLRPYNVYAWLDLSGMFHDFNNLDRARYYIEKAQEEYQTIKDMKIGENHRVRMQNHITMARVNLNIWNKKYGNATAELKKMDSFPLSDQMQAGVLFTQALLYNLQGEHQKAEEVYKRLLVEFDTESRDVGANNYLWQLLLSGRYEDAKRLLNSAPDIFERLKTSYIAPSVYRNLMYLYRAEGDYEKAFAYSDSLVYASDSLASVHTALYGSGLVDQIEDMERVRIAEKSAAEKGRMLVWVSISGAIAVVIAIIAVVLWLGLLKRNRDVRNLESDLSTLGDSHKKEMKDTVDNLESRNRELTSTTMRLAAISTGIDHIKQLASDTTLDREKMAQSIIEELKRLSFSEGVWEMFSYYFDNVNTGFYDRLREYCPQLTNAERRMCAFIIMNLTNKEIASLTNRSVRTVECIKYNLKRKLGIEMPTEKFLMALNSGELPPGRFVASG